MNCGVGHRHISDPELLWLWCRLVVVASIRPLAWELPYAVGVAQKRHKKSVNVTKVPGVLSSARSPEIPAS